MNAASIIQESIVNVSAPIFLNRLMLFNLISDRKREELKNSIEWERKLKSNNNVSTITTFIIKKLKECSHVTHYDTHLYPSAACVGQQNPLTRRMSWWSHYSQLVSTLIISLV